MIQRTIILAFCMSICLPSFGQKTLNEYYEEGVSAYESGDYKQYQTLMEMVDEMRPNYPNVVFRLAEAYALNGRKIRSIQRLQQLMLMDATYDFQNDPDFDSIRKNKGYHDLVELQIKLIRIEEHDEVFRTIDAGMLHPESFVVMDNGDILLGSIRQKKIVRVDMEGNKMDLVKTPYSVLGMHLDPVNGTLWAATAAMPEMEDFDPKEYGKSLIMEIDPVSGRVHQGIEYDEQSIIGDLALDSKSRIWLSNSMEPILSRNSTDTLSYVGAFVRKQYDLTNNFFNLQGLALSEDEQFLYFSDYISGIYKVNIATDDVTKVFAVDDVLLKGIDGLYFYNDTLIAIHNGVKPYHIMQYYLDETGNNIVLARVINRGGPSLGEPTLGQVKDGYFYYLANSPWGAYDEEHNLIPEKVKPIEIRRVQLN